MTNMTPSTSHATDECIGSRTTGSAAHPGSNVNDYNLDDIEFVDYVDESQLEHVMKLVLQDLSEPYSST